MMWTPERICGDCSQIHLYSRAKVAPSGRAESVWVEWSDLVVCRCGGWVQVHRSTRIPKRRDCRWLSAVVKACEHCGCFVHIAWFVGGAERQRCARVYFSDSLPMWRQRLRRLLLQRAGVDA